MLLIHESRSSEFFSYGHVMMSTIMAGVMIEFQSLYENDYATAQLCSHVSALAGRNLACPKLFRKSNLFFLRCQSWYCVFI